MCENKVALWPGEHKKVPFSMHDDSTEAEIRSPLGMSRYLYKILWLHSTGGWQNSLFETDYTLLIIRSTSRS